MKVRIEGDEKYPVYDFVDEWPNLGHLVEVDEATAARWRRVIAEWEQVQEEMAAAPSVGR